MREKVSVSAYVLAASLLMIPSWLSPVRSEPTAPCGVPGVIDDDWQLATQVSEGIDPKRLCSLTAKLKNEKVNIHSVLVIRHNRLLFEYYQTGSDQKWGRLLGPVVHRPNVKHDLRSVSKSVVSLLFGIALDRNLISSVDEPVLEFFPKYRSLRTPAKERILLRHLLTMSSGISWDEKRSYSDPENSERRMVEALDPYHFILEQPLVADPGTVWNYSGGSTALLGAILQRVSGKYLAEFAREALFEPLGIIDFEWVKMQHGEIAAASGLRLRSRDMAKIGQLILSKGVWNGRRIVSAKWLEESITPRFLIEPFYHYGYHWWISSSLLQNRKLDWFEAYGLGNQRIIIVPSLDLVVVFTTGLYNAENLFWTTELLENFILPAIIR